MRNKTIAAILISQIFFCQLIFAQQARQEKGVGNLPISKLPAAEKRWALIIGVDAYQKDISPLYGTVNDAKALRDVLIKSAGFTDERIILMTTDSSDSDLLPTKGNIIDQLEKLSRLIPEDGLILFSFSGHGVSIGDDAFIVPSDGRIFQNAEYMRERAIDVLRIKRAIQATKVKQVIMFLDACRNDPVRAKGEVDNNLTTAYASGFSFETKNQNIEAYATLYATSFGDRAYEFLDKKTNKYRGYFSYAIEEGLKGSAANDKGEVTLAGLIRYIEDTVKERVRINLNQRQIPYPTTEGFRNSDLVIAVAERNTPITTNTNSSEATFWSAIENSNNVEDFRLYLEKYPNGIYINLVELKIKQLTRKANPTETKETDTSKITSTTLTWSSFRETARNALKYDVFDLFSEDLAAVRIGDYQTGKWGYVNKSGNLVIPLRYDFAYEFSEGRARIESNNKYGYIDINGREIIPAKYDSGYSFSEGFALVKLDFKSGFIDKSGREVIPLKYDEASSFSEGLAAVNTGGKWDFIDTTGRKVIQNLYYGNIRSFSEGLAAMSFRNKFGFINKTGKVKIPFKYNDVDSFSEGLAAVKIGSKWGFIDKTGQQVIPLKYDSAGKFSEGLAAVMIGDKWGFIDKTGRLVIAAKYGNNGNFEDGLVWEGTEFAGGKKGFTNKKGEEVIPFKYDEIWCVAFRKEGFIGVILNGKKGFADIYGNEYFDF